MEKRKKHENSESFCPAAHMEEEEATMRHSHQPVKEEEPGRERECAQYRESAERLSVTMTRGISEE